MRQLYFRFHLSFRDVEELLAERGIMVSYEAIRHWCYMFGPGYAADLCRRRAQPGDKGHVDEVLLKIAGKQHWLWRAVDQNGIVLDILVQERRDEVAAERFLRQVLASCEYEPRVVITDKLMSYVPATRARATEQRASAPQAAEQPSQKTHTCRRASASGFCSGSNLSSTPSASWVHSALSATTSVHADTD